GGRHASGCWSGGLRRRLGSSGRLLGPRRLASRGRSWSSPCRTIAASAEGRRQTRLLSAGPARRRRNWRYGRDGRNLSWYRLLIHRPKIYFRRVILSLAHEFPQSVKLG